MSIRWGDHAGDRSAVEFDKQTYLRTVNPSVPVIVNHFLFFAGIVRGINRTTEEVKIGEIVAVGRITAKTTS